MLSLVDLTTRDLADGLVEMPTPEGVQEAIIDLAHFSGEKAPPPEEVKKKI